MRHINIIALLTMVAILMACHEETVELDADQTEEFYILDGEIINKDTTQELRLTKSVAYNEEEVPGVSNANITVSDNQGNTFHFEEASKDGFYHADFEGKTGTSYSINIDLEDGNTITARDSMKQSVSIDSITFKKDEERYEGLVDTMPKAKVDTAHRFYRLKLYGKEPGPSSKYMIKIYKKGQPFYLANRTNDSTASILSLNGDLLAGRFRGLELGPYYGKGDTVKFEIHNISNGAFSYYEEMFTVRGSGSLFSPPPANPSTNLEARGTKALGYFLTSGYAEETVVIEPEK